MRSSDCCNRYRNTPASWSHTVCRSHTPRPPSAALATLLRATGKFADFLTVADRAASTLQGVTLATAFRRAVCTPSLMSLDVEIHGWTQRLGCGDSFATHAPARALAPNYERPDLRLFCYNVRGFMRALDAGEIKHMLDSYKPDVIVLTEFNLKVGNKRLFTENLPGYTVFQASRQPRGQKGFYGGLAIALSERVSRSYKVTRVLPLATVQSHLCALRLSPLQASVPDIVLVGAYMPQETKSQAVVLDWLTGWLKKQSNPECCNTEAGKTESRVPPEVVLTGDWNACAEPTMARQGNAKDPQLRRFCASTGVSPLRPTHANGIPVTDAQLADMHTWQSDHQSAHSYIDQVLTPTHGRIAASHTAGHNNLTVTTTCLPQTTDRSRCASIRSEPLAPALTYEHRLLPRRTGKGSAATRRLHTWLVTTWHVLTSSLINSQCPKRTLTACYRVRMALCLTLQRSTWTWQQT